MVQWKAEFKEKWAAGEFTDMSQFGTAILNAKAIGNCEALDNIIGLEFSQLESELSHGE